MTTNLALIFEALATVSSQAPSTAPSSSSSGVKLIAAQPMTYPVEALLHHQEGRTTVQISIDQKGTVRRCAVTASSGFRSLDKATCDSVKLWRFAPATDDKGRPIKSVIGKSIAWRLPLNEAGIADRAGGQLR